MYGKRTSYRILLEDQYIEANQNFETKITKARMNDSSLAKRRSSNSNSPYFIYTEECCHDSDENSKQDDVD